MLVLVALLLTLIPAIAILYPFLRRRRPGEELEEEGSPESDLARLWESTIVALKNTDLEWEIGNLAEEDHRRIREHYMTEAAIILKKMDLAEDEERALLKSVDLEVQQFQLSANAEDGAGTSLTCPHCFFDVAESARECLNCGERLVSVDLPAAPGPDPAEVEPAS